MSKHPALPIRKAPILSFDAATFMEFGSMMSREQILIRLAQDHVVIHSTPPTGRHIPAPAGGITELHPNLYHYSNPWFLPLIYKSSALEKFARKLRRLHRKNKLRSKSARDKPILYLWHPFFADEIGMYNESILVYHIYDDYSTLPGASSNLIEKELKILRRADIVFVANARLLNERKQLVDREYIHLQQGVDFAAFEAARTSAIPPPLDISSIPHPRIGYIGRLNEKVDLGLVEALIAARPDWQFVFVGPMEPSISEHIARMKAHNNVHVLGRKSFGEVATYWNELDVAVIPYRHESGQWAHFGSPLKLREALAAGKPIVASPLDDIEAHGSLVQTASSLDDWLIAIDAAIGQINDHELQSVRIDYARQNSWDARVAQIEEIIAATQAKV